jgi:ferredoxin-NADP reductase/MOSC domain-containing protein YiiM
MRNAGIDPDACRLAGLREIWRNGIVATLLSVNVGQPKDVEWQGRTVHTGIWKRPVDGPRMARRLNLDGDGQGDLNGHGGEQRAVLVYQIDSYRHWQDFFGRDGFEYGQFGDNFTVDGLSDDEVCIGDRYLIGRAEFEVTQPRVTCFRVGMRMGEPQLPALLVAHRRPGFYLRVITEGQVQAGDEITRTRRGPHALSVADADALLYLPDRDIDRLRAAVDIAALSPGWQQSFRDLLRGAEGGADIPAPDVGVEPGWTGFRPMRIDRVVRENSIVRSFYLTTDGGRDLPEPKAGQYLTLRLPGAGEPAPVRSYSISSSPRGDAYRISVKREPKGLVSSYVHTQLHGGATVDVAAPRGDFVLDDDGGPVILMSAGIGVTPVLAMLHHLAAASSTREVCWVHVARSPDEHAFAVEAHHLLQSLGHAGEHVFYTAGAGERADDESVARGRPTAAALEALHLPSDAAAYLCGPASFMSDMSDALVEIGVDRKRVHTELFTTRPALNPGVTDVPSVSPHQPTGPSGTGPQVTFARSGLSARWSDRQRSLLELAEACDVPTRWSCRTGVCHNCITPLLSGGIEYSPEPLERPGGGQALICCSQPDEDVVLDL